MAAAWLRLVIASFYVSLISRDYNNCAFAQTARTSTLYICSLSVRGEYYACRFLTPPEMRFSACSGLPSTSWPAGFCLPEKRPRPRTIPSQQVARRARPRRRAAAARAPPTASARRFIFPHTCPFPDDAIGDFFAVCRIQRATGSRRMPKRIAPSIATRAPGFVSASARITLQSFPSLRAALAAIRFRHDIALAGRRVHTADESTRFHHDYYYCARLCRVAAKISRARVLAIFKSDASRRSFGISSFASCRRFLFLAAIAELAMPLLSLRNADSQDVILIAQAKPLRHGSRSIT